MVKEGGVLMVRYIGQCQLCSFETEPTDDRDEADSLVFDHITNTHVDDYIDAHIEIIETEEVS